MGFYNSTRPSHAAGLDPSKCCVEDAGITKKENVLGHKLSHQENVNFFIYLRIVLLIFFERSFEIKFFSCFTCAMVVCFGGSADFGG